MSPRISRKPIAAKFSNKPFGNQDMRHHHTAKEQGDRRLAWRDCAADLPRQATD
jgi:hypothetical protein